MNFQFYLEKLFASREFEKFRNENPKAFLCSGFFSIDKKGEDNQQHLDYFNPETKKMFSFKFKEGIVEVVPVEDYGVDVKIDEVSDNLDFDFGEIERKIEEKILGENVNKKVEKILLSLQNKDAMNFLIGTVFLSGLRMVKITINLDDGKIEDFENKSFFDMLKIVKKGD